MAVKFVSKQSKYSDKLDLYFSGKPFRNTKIAYKNDLDNFRAWSKKNGLREHYPVSEDQAVLFVREKLKSKSLATVQRYVSALSFIHEHLELESPFKTREVKQLLSNARKTRANEPKARKKKSPITLDILKSVIDRCDDSPIGLRDKALFLFSFATGGRKRSEISSASMREIIKERNGYTYRPFSNRTSHAGNRKEFPVLGVAGKALEIWLRRASIDEGYIFRQVNKGGRITQKGISDKLVDRVIKKRIQQVGLNPDEYSAQSIRSGFIIEAGELGIPAEEVWALAGTGAPPVGMYRTVDPLDSVAARITDRLATVKGLRK